MLIKLNTNRLQGLLAMRPFFDFMTEALTTNLNGEQQFYR